MCSPWTTERVVKDAIIQQTADENCYLMGANFMTQENGPKNVARVPLEQWRSWCSKESLHLQAGRAHWRAGERLIRGCRALPSRDSNGHRKRHAGDPRTVKNGDHTTEIGKCKFATTYGRTRSGAPPPAPGSSVQSSAASVLQAQDLDGQDINAEVEVPPATRSSKKAAAPKTNECDDDEV